MEGHTPGGEARHPPIGGRRSHTLHGGCASMHGVQRPISLEYQIYPPAIDTLVTGMADASVCLSHYVARSLLRAAEKVAEEGEELLFSHNTA